MPTVRIIVRNAPGLLERRYSSVLSVLPLTAVRPLLADIPAQPAANPSSRVRTDIRSRSLEAVISIG
jgi:hypothetical protein